jgi:asparagine synthase (glutamine-hydrolysing)
MPGLFGFVNFPAQDEFENGGGDLAVTVLGISKVGRLAMTSVDSTSANSTSVNRKNVERLDAMARALEAGINLGETTAKRSIATDLCAAVNGGLGVTRLSASCLTAQVAGDDAAQLHCAFYGEIFDTGSLRRKVQELGYPLANASPAELTLRAYQAFGEEFVQHLNGSWAAALWHLDQGEILLANDHLGAQALYYAHYMAGDQERLAFATGVRALLADAHLPRRIDATAIAQVLRYEMPLADRTYLQDVKLLPPASLLRLRAGRLSLRPYWRLGFADVYALHSPQTYEEQLFQCLQQAAHRQLSANLRCGINLSGGLDSRIILGSLTKNIEPANLHAFTFGLPDSDDMRIATELAQISGVAHHSLPLRADFLKEIVESGVRLTDGMNNAVHWHALTLLPSQSQVADVVFTGFMGDTILSSEVKPDWILPYDERLVRQRIDEAFACVFPGRSQQALLTAEFLKQAADSFQQDLAAVLAAAASSLTCDAVNHFEVVQLGRRNTQFGNDLLRSHVACRTIFCDKDVIEFCLKLPPALRLQRQISQSLIANRFRELAKVPWDKSGLPLADCMRDVQVRIAQQIRWQWSKLWGNPQLRVRRNRPMTDYAAWMRRDLRPLIEATLLSKRALARGYLKPEVQRQTVQEHMAGADRSRDLGMLLSLEVWHQLFMD